VLAGRAAGLDIEVLGDTAGDIGSPARVAAGVNQRRVDVDDVHAVHRRQISERDHAEASHRSWRWRWVPHHSRAVGFAALAIQGFGTVRQVGVPAWVTATEPQPHASTLPRIGQGSRESHKPRSGGDGR
jgi:hypothetical protein